MSFYQKSGSQASGSDHRRKWDVNEYAAKANERLAAEREAMEEKQGKSSKSKGPKVRRELLQARTDAVNLESRIGKQVTINKTTATEDSGGFYCDVCECTLKDSINYLDHINGKNHQRKLGYSMKVKRSTVDDVVNRIALKKAELQQKANKDHAKEEDEILKEEAAKLADHRRLIAERKKGTKRPAEPEEEAVDEEADEMAKMMGFGGFGTSKKPK